MGFKERAWLPTSIVTILVVFWAHSCWWGLGGFDFFHKVIDDDVIDVLMEEEK